MSRRSGAQQLIKQLYHLSKDGKKDQFLTLIESSTILRRLDSLDGYQSSLLIYAFHKLKFNNHDIWKKLETLYMTNQGTMNIHDNIMCGWAFINNVHSPDIWRQFSGVMMQNVQQLLTQQHKSCNLGLLAYILSSKRITDPDLWNRIEWVFRQTAEQQDERNFTLLIYSFSRMNFFEPIIWDSFEGLVLSKPFKEFKIRNQILLLYSFAKAQAGNYIHPNKRFAATLDALSRIDSDAQIHRQAGLVYASMVPMIRKRQGATFDQWSQLIDHCVAVWKDFLIHDLEGIFWACLHVMNTMGFTAEQLESLRKRIGQLEITDILTSNRKFTPIEELGSIAKILEDMQLGDSPLAKSVAHQFFAMLNATTFKEYNKRLWILKSIFAKHPQRFPMFSSYCLDRLTSQTQRLRPALDQLHLYIDIIILATVSNCVDQEIWVRLAENFLNDQPIEDTVVDQFTYVGLQLYHNLQDQTLRQQLLTTLSDMRILQLTYPKQSNLLSLMKAFALSNPPTFFINFIAFVKAQGHIKPDYLARLLLVLFQRCSIVVQKEHYAIFKSDIEELHANHCLTALPVLLDKLQLLIADATTACSVEELTARLADFYPKAGVNLLKYCAVEQSVKFEHDEHPLEHLLTLETVHPKLQDHLESAHSSKID